VEKSGVVCQEPLANIFEDTTCFLHVQVPSQQKIFTKKKYETDSEEEEPEASGFDVKKEEMYGDAQMFEGDCMDIIEEVVTTTEVETQNITIKHEAAVDI
jgi:KAT8 regulatory NSL complex subunit 2